MGLHTISAKSRLVLKTAAFKRVSGSPLDVTEKLTVTAESLTFDRSKTIVIDESKSFKTAGGEVHGFPTAS